MLERIWIMILQYIQKTIPSDWELVEVQDIADQVMVGIASAATHAYSATGIPMIRNTNIKAGAIETSDILYIDPVYERSHKNKRLRAGDIVTVRTGYPGVSAVVPITLEGAQCFTSLITRPRNDKVISEYLCAFINSPVGEKQFEIGQAGGAQKNVNVSTLCRMLVPLPSKREQEVIIHALKKWDQAIELAEQLIAAKEERWKWLMQQLLTGKRRLPGFAKPWNTVHLGEVFTNRVETDVPNLPLVAITGENGVVSRDELARRDTSSEDKSRYLRICPGDIGYNTMRMWQGVCGLSTVEGIVSPAYTIVTPEESIDAEFMSLFFKFPHTINLFRRYSQGLVDDTLNLKWRHFAEIKVSIPEKREQKGIAKVFRTADQELKLLRTKLGALQEQKKGLMQQLLTGKRRVKV